MADHFLTKTRISLADCLEIDGTLALERHDELQAQLSERVGPGTAALFAEPLISKGNDEAPPTVSWYTDFDGEGTPLDGLDGAARSQAEAHLSAHLRPLRALAGDPAIGQLVGAALHIASAADVWVINGQPVLINWGMMPAGQGRDPSARAAHYAATLGRFLPLAAAPPLSAGDLTAFGTTDLEDQASAAAAASPATAAPPSPPSSPPSPPPLASAAAGSGPDRPARLSPVAWVPLVILLLLAGATLLWLTLPNTRLFPASTAGNAIESPDAVALAEEVNRNLTQRRETLRAALDGAVCRADGTLLVPGNRTIEGLLPPVPGTPGNAPGDRTEAVPDSVLPADPARVVVPDRASGSTTEIELTSLLGVIEARTVMLVVQSTSGQMTSGTGFVVGPGLIVSNHHVVAEAAPNGIIVTNKALGRAQPAEILKIFGPLETVGGDFALLRIADTSLPAFELLNSPETLKLQNVVAAGYPGDVLETDAAFASLRSGNASAIPGLTVTDGSINTEQKLAATTNVLVHSAPISRGNSGGPLVDMCGRLVGMNTFVKRGPMRNLNFALAVPDLLQFLAGTPVQAGVVSQRCAPQVLRPTAPPAEAAQAAPEAGQPAMPVFE